MKKKARRALKHELELAGRNIPTLAVAMALLVGLGSAAVLQTYGTVSGTAEVDQSVTFGDTEQARLDATYSDVVAGDTVTTATTIQNNREEAVEVELDTNYTTPGSTAWQAQSDVNGVTTSHLVTYQLNSDAGESSGKDQYGVTTETVDPVSDGDYAVRFTSGGDVSDDYATVYYTVSGLKSSDVLKFRSETGSGHDAGGTVDEVYFVTDEGEVYSAHTDQDDSSSSVSVELDKLSFTGGSAPAWSNVVAVGIGFGDGSLIQDSNDYSSGKGATVDVTVDDVRVGGSNIDEMGDTEFELLSTGDLIAPEGASYSFDAESRYSFTAVTSFDTAVVPGKYTVSNRLDPAS